MTNPRPSWNRWAIASFVLGIAPCAPLGVLFGAIALTRGKDQRGRALAIVGIVLSLLWVVVAASVLWRGFSDDAVEEAGKLRVGDCIAEYDTSVPYTDLEPVSCSQPHVGEVVATLRMRNVGDSTYDRCQVKLNEYAPSASREGIVFLEADSPGGTLWKMGHRSLLCLALSESPRTGSIKEPDDRHAGDFWPIVAIAAGVVSCVAVGAVIATATSETLKRRGRRGRWLALGMVVAVGSWGLAAVAVWQADSSSDSGPAFSRVGRCLRAVPPDVKYQEYVMCSQPHGGEVFAQLSMAEYETSGATEQCQERLEAYAPAAGRDGSVEVFAWVPDQYMWEAGKRTTECVAVSRPARTGSIKG